MYPNSALLRFLVWLALAGSCALLGCDGADTAVEGQGTAVVQDAVADGGGDAGDGDAAQATDGDPPGDTASGGDGTSGDGTSDGSASGDGSASDGDGTSSVDGDSTGGADTPSGDGGGKPLVGCTSVADCTGAVASCQGWTCQTGTCVAVVLDNASA